MHYSVYYYSLYYYCIHKYLHVCIVCIGLIKTARLFQPRRPSLITDAQSFMVRTLAATYFLPCTLALGLAPRNEDTCGLGILWSARPQLDLLFQSTAALILCTDEEHLGVCQNALAWFLHNTHGPLPSWLGSWPYHNIEWHYLHVAIAAELWM